MVTTQRTLLVIEDDQVLNTLYKIHCEAVLTELPHVDGIVEQAFNYGQAQEFLKTQPVDFISVDIALSQEEEGKTDREREEQEAGGITLLKQLQKAERQPLVVIVSGETLLSYAIDAYRKYGILAFYQKDRFNNDEYRHAVKAALLYLDAIDLLKKPEIEAAFESWQQARAAAKVAGINEQQFPEAIEDKIETRWTHSVTRLPLGRWTEERLRKRVVERNDWALIRATLKGFNEFVTIFGSQEESILAFAADLLKQAGQEFQDQDLFIGHLGYREFVPEPSFVLILGERGLDCVTEITAWLKSEFDKRDGVFVPAFKNTGGPQTTTLTLETSILKGTEQRFEDLHRLLDTLGST